MNVQMVVKLLLYQIICITEYENNCFLKIFNFCGVPGIAQVFPVILPTYLLKKAELELHWHRNYC